MKCRNGTLKFRIKARALFQKHPEHIMGLDIFLPEGYNMSDASTTTHKDERR